MKRTIKLTFDDAKLLILFISLLGLSILMQFGGNEYFSALGSNLFAGFIGAAATVYGIDLLIKQREEKRLLPAKAASYEDIRIMTHWALHLWKEAYINSIGDSAPKSWADLFSPTSIEKIAISLDITKPANVSPKQPWFIYFDDEMEEIQKNAEKVLERNIGLLDSDIHRAVYMLIYYGKWRISTIRHLDSQQGTPRPTNLGGFIPLCREWFEGVLTMHHWTIETYSYLKKRGISRSHQPYYFSPLETKNNLPAKFDDGVFELQCIQFMQFQEQQKANRT